MELNAQTADGALVFELSGVLTFDDHEKFRAVTQSIVNASAASVELSLAHLSMIDSAGIGMLLLANDKARKSGISLCITGVSGHVAKVVELSKIGQLIPIR